ncbi:MAG TPA: phosphatidylglycerophosphatase A [Pyrinomonadaceae bacterium]|nr:phosphatidylglycerophosphatase A [Pyrinomonadaceae bacterium]
MTAKDSNQEVSAPVVNSERVLTTPPRSRSVKDYLALAIATCGVGYLPLAPGTWGSLVGLVLYYCLRDAYVRLKFLAFEHHLVDKNVFSEELYRDSFLFLPVLLLSIWMISLVGTWAASRTERLSARKDPGIVVIDEVVGQMLTFIFLPFFSVSLGPLIVGFVAFRFFDIVKPYPARRFEALPGGLGIMADDLVAGAYAALLLSVLSFFSISGGITTAW